MLIGSNEACELLAACSISRRYAQRALAAGLAGEPQRVRSRVLYDRDRVLQLAKSRDVAWWEVLHRCPAGVFLSRRPVSVTSSREALVAALSDGWGVVNAWRMLALRFQVERLGSVPFLATVAGFVVLGADIVDVPGLQRLVLVEPGPWFGDFAGTRLHTGPGRSWVLHVGPLRPAKMAG